MFIAHARRVQHSLCSSIFIECCSILLSRYPLVNFYARKKSLRTNMHSVRLEPTKLILAGTQTTYQANGDARYIGISGRWYDYGGW